MFAMKHDNCPTCTCAEPLAPEVAAAMTGMTPADATRDEALVEAVARALHKYQSISSWSKSSKVFREDCRAQAEIAIAVVRAHDAAAPRNEWKPIETAPKDGTRLLAYEKGCALYEIWWQRNLGDQWDGWQDDWDDEPEPTHWMPLPAPPLAPHEAETAGGEGGQ